MDIVKKNLASIIFGVVAILAAVAVFVWPLDGYYEDLKTKTQARAANAQKIKSLESKPRELPPTKLEETTAQPLGRFPSKDVIKVGKDAREQVEKRSAEVYRTALGLNENGKGPIVKGVLPEQTQTTVAIRFAQHYAQALKQLRTDILQAGVPPTEEEFKRREDVLWKSMEKELIYVPGQQEAVNKDQVLQKFNLAKAGLPQVMQTEMATRFKMYVDPASVFKLPQELPVNTAPDPAQVWWCHVEYWVYRDICNAIADVNKNSNSVLKSPVKNLLLLRVPWNYFPPQGAVAAAPPPGGQFGGGGGFEDPSAVPATGGLPDSTIAVPDGSSVSPSKRLSNNLYDVIHFDLAVDIDAAAVPLFLKTLGTNRFITVLEMDMESVDSDLLKFDGYVYGDRPVVKLLLRCEALQMREWTIKYMPRAIRQMLGIPDQQSPGLTQPALPRAAL